MGSQEDLRAIEQAKSKAYEEAKKTGDSRGLTAKYYDPLVTRLPPEDRALYRSQIEGRVQAGIEKYKYIDKQRSLSYSAGRTSATQRGAAQTGVTRGLIKGGGTVEGSKALKKRLTETPKPETVPIKSGEQVGVIKDTKVPAYYYGQGQFVSFTSKETPEVEGEIVKGYAVRRKLKEKAEEEQQKFFGMIKGQVERVEFDKKLQQETAIEQYNRLLKSDPKIRYMTKEAKQDIYESILEERYKGTPLGAMRAAVPPSQDIIVSPKAFQRSDISIKAITPFERAGMRSRRLASKVVGATIDPKFLGEEGYTEFAKRDPIFMTTQKFVRGGIKEFEKYPVKAALTGAAFVAIPYGLSLVRYAGVRYGIPAITKVAGRYAPKIFKGVSFAEKAGTYGLTGLYTGSVGVRLYLAPKGERAEKAGAITVGELLPMYYGAKLGTKLSFRREYRTRFEAELQKLPPESREEFRQLLKARPKIEEIKPKEIEFGDVEGITPKAAKRTKEFFQKYKDEAIIGGSLAQRTQLVSTKGMKKAGDIDVFADRPKELARSYYQYMKGEGFDVRLKGKKVYFERKGKLAEFHYIKPKEGEPTLSTTIKTVQHPFLPLSEAITKTPSGIKVTKLKYQAQRKLYGGFEEQQYRYSKDIPSFKQISLQAFKQMEVRAKESLFFRETRLKEIKRRKGVLKDKRVEFEEEEEIFKIIKRKAPPTKEYPSYAPYRGKTPSIYKTFGYREEKQPSIVPTYKPPVAPTKPPTYLPQKLTKDKPYIPIEPTKDKPYIVPIDKKEPSYVPPIAQLEVSKYAPPPTPSIVPTYKPPVAPQKPPPTTPYEPYKPYKPPSTPVLFFPFDIKAKEKERQRQPRGKRVTAYTPSLTAIGLGIYGKTPKGQITGLEFRPIPVKFKKEEKKKKKKKDMLDIFGF